MEKYIKYKRFSETCDKESLQKLFDSFITDGWEIIWYNELKMHEDGFHVTIVCGKKQKV